MYISAIFRDREIDAAIELEETRAVEKTLRIQCRRERR